MVASVWKLVLPLSGSASVHDSASDKWPPQSQGEEYFKHYDRVLSLTVTVFTPAFTQLEEDFSGWENVYGVLRGQTLLCYQSEEDCGSDGKPLLKIPIKKVGSKH